jgi:hypothetical protein
MGGAVSAACKQRSACHSLEGLIHHALSSARSTAHHLVRSVSQQGTRTSTRCQTGVRVLPDGHAWRLRGSSVSARSSGVLDSAEQETGCQGPPTPGDGTATAAAWITAACASHALSSSMLLTCAQLVIGAQTHDSQETQRAWRHTGLSRAGPGSVHCLRCSTVVRSRHGMLRHAGCKF